ncbi:LON peptidase substrate-binding domain-containing protein [bacterium]|nr:LON peptidase substrate-binding domain-containing protein [bacterium]
MQNLNDVTRLPDGFDGQVRLFPLPNLVVFPHAMQPLHLFEPRYVEMVKEALEGDRLITMATLIQPSSVDWPTNQAPISPTVCIGKIVTHSEQEDNRHNVLLVGIRRARIVAEIDAGKAYRLAQVELIEDSEEASNDSRSLSLKSDLLDAFGEVMPVGKSVQQNLHQLMADQMSLGPITDIVGYTLPFSLEEKLVLLGQGDVAERAKFLLECIKSGSVQFSTDSDDESDDSSGDFPSGQVFPPPFSMN